MALIKCPNCGHESVSDKAVSCPRCNFKISTYANASEYHKEGEQSASNTNTKQNTNDRSLFMAILLLLIIIIVVYFFTTRCSYDGCYEKKISYSKYCSYHKAKQDSYLSYINNYDSTLYSNYEVTSKNEYDLKISDVKVYSNSSSTYCTGTIKNTGTDTFKFVQVKGSFKDNTGNVIETGNSYAVGSEGLAPDESTTFKIYCEKNRLIDSCDISIYDYD